MNNVKIVSAASEHVTYTYHHRNITVQIICTQLHIQNIDMHWHASACLHMYVCVCISIHRNYSYTARFHFISYTVSGHISTQRNNTKDSASPSKQ